MIQRLHAVSSRDTLLMRMKTLSCLYSKHRHTRLPSLETGSCEKSHSVCRFCVDVKNDNQNTLHARRGERLETGVISLMHERQQESRCFAMADMQEKQPVHVSLHTITVRDENTHYFLASWEMERGKNEDV